MKLSSKKEDSSNVVVVLISALVVSTMCFGFSMFIGMRALSLDEQDELIRLNQTSTHSTSLSTKL